MTARAPADAPVDALVIGGGFAGLSAAIHLAAAGRSVRLLEQDATLGGKAGEVREAGFRFDTGPSVFTLPHVLEDVFAAAGRSSPIPLEPLDPLCRYRYPDGFVWDVSTDVEATVAQLPAPERQPYRDLLDEARRLFEAAAPTFVYGAPPTLADLAAYGVRHGLRAHPLRTLPQLLDRFGAGPRTRPFFLRFATYYGADPFRAPAVLHNIAWVELGLGVSFPRGGMRAVVDALGDLAADLGVDVVTGARVTHLAVEHGRLAAVRWTRDDGGGDRPERVEAPGLTVAAIDRQRVLRALGRAPRPIAPSLSGTVLLLGVERPDGAPASPHHAIDFPIAYRDEFRDLAAGRFPRDPTLYTNVTGASDAGDAPPGWENWFVLANAPPLPPAGQGGPELEAMASTIEATLRARGRLDGRAVRVRRALGPGHFARYGHRGSIYGRAPHSLGATLRPGLRVPGVEGLWLAGGTVYPGGGVPLALLSGRAAARAALGG